MDVCSFRCPGGLSCENLDICTNFITVNITFSGGPKNLLPIAPVGQILAGAWWLVAIILYAVYTSNLIAFLAVDITAKPFNSLRDLVEQDEYQYGVEDGIVQMMLFKVGCERYSSGHIVQIMLKVAIQMMFQVRV